MTGMTAIVDISAAASDRHCSTVVALADGADAATTVSTTATVDATAPPGSISAPPARRSALQRGPATTSPSARRWAPSRRPCYNALTLTDTLPEGETLTGPSSTATWDCA